MTMKQFVLASPTDENMFRAIVLFGRNSSSYKFAFATALIGFAEQGRDIVPITELAKPYALALCSHLKNSPKQCTQSSSKFLSECQRFNAGKIALDELVGVTTRLGFENVIDTFHRVSNANIPIRFFQDDRKTTQPSIVITNSLLTLASRSAGITLQETDSRWSLVETAWALGTTTAVIGFDPVTGDLVLPVKRKPITSARPALNGYQKGVCFYCYKKMAMTTGASDSAEVDHLFPHVLMAQGLAKNLDGIWNLVLACKDCNRGPKGKFDSTPHKKYVERLHDRNEYLILSNLPLRETLIKQTGNLAPARMIFLQMNLDTASKYQPIPWETQPVGPKAF